MKSVYLDIMEEALSAYSDEAIRDYIKEVRENGLTEHGFPRLGANLGVLMAHGRRLEMKKTFMEIIELCLYGFAHPINKTRGGNNFAVREICLCLMELEKTNVIEKETLARWKKQLSSLKPHATYTYIVCDAKPCPFNWACFALVSEQARGLYCGFDPTAFVDHQLPSQLFRCDENGMYRDRVNWESPYQPMVYDLVTRHLIGLTLLLGYQGKYARQCEEIMEKTDTLTLQMQSVTGEIAYGGRSQQFLHNEMLLASYYELRATLLHKKGDDPMAGKFKAAAALATNRLFWWLRKKPLSHVKNRYDPESLMGCEKYAYFNKYMISVASNAYSAYLAADDAIVPTETVTDAGGYVTETSHYFHKVFLNAGGYFIEIDCNADVGNDANGLGRIHKRNCDPRICLSTPAPDEVANYETGTPNRHPLSLCGYRNTENGLLCSAEAGFLRTLTAKSQSPSLCRADFQCQREDEAPFQETYTVSKDGVSASFLGADGILLPVFFFDGEKETRITVEEGQILVENDDSFCRYRFSGKAEEYGSFFTRNGLYRAYKIPTTDVHVEIGEHHEI